MKKEELVSIIIPFHNAEKYLNRILTDVTGQSYKTLEILLVNDSSKDRSCRVCRRWEEKDDRVRCIDPKWEKSKGVSAARNEGIRHARGNYILFWDADDETDTETVRMLFQAFGDFKSEHQLQADITLCGYREIFAGGFGEKIHLPAKRTYADRQMLEAVFSDDGFFSSVWNKMFRRECLKNDDGNWILFPEGIHIAEDTLWLIKVLRRAHFGAAVQRPLYQWIRKPDSATGKENQQANGMNIRNLSVIPAYQMIVRELRDYDSSLCHYTRKIYMGLMRDSLLEAQKEGRDKLKYLFMKKAIRELAHFHCRMPEDFAFICKYRLCLHLLRLNVPNVILNKMNAIRG